MFNLIFNKVNIVIVKSVFQLGYGSQYYVVSSSGNRTVTLGLWLPFLCFVVSSTSSTMQRFPHA